MIDESLANTCAQGGLAPRDIERFWAGQEIALRDPFGAEIPQVPLDVLMSGECVYDELNIPEDYWRYETDESWRLELLHANNDRTAEIVGRNDEASILADFLRDFSMVGEIRGQVFSTADAINNSSHLTGMRLLMAAIQRYGRYA